MATEPDVKIFLTSREGQDSAEEYPKARQVNITGSEYIVHHARGRSVFPKENVENIEVAPDVNIADRT
jgi:hypothetical protein